MDARRRRLPRKTRPVATGGASFSLQRRLQPTCLVGRGHALPPAFEPALVRPTTTLRWSVAIKPRGLTTFFAPRTIAEFRAFVAKKAVCPLCCHRPEGNFGELRNFGDKSAMVRSSKPSNGNKTQRPRTRERLTKRTAGALRKRKLRVLIGIPAWVNPQPATSYHS